MSVIKFVLIGHVDHGKSTCGGRILVNTNTVSEQDITKACKDAETNNMKSWWLAYLLDSGNERLNGKTQESISIDINHKNQTLEMIDVPGHKKYISEMIEGTSKANVAVLVISAKKGELESGLKGQTYEHLILSRSLGIKHLIVAVNKMDHDSVIWSEKIYDDIKLQVTNLVSELKFCSINFVPISALDGTNIVSSKNDQKPLLDIICDVDKNNIEKINNIYKNIKKFKAGCIFVNVENLISIGYECVLHSYDGNKSIVTECEIIKIIGKSFITSKDTLKPKFIQVEIEINKECDLGSLIILRNGDNTIAMGRIISQN